MRADTPGKPGMSVLFDLRGLRPLRFSLKLLEAKSKTWETFAAQIAACDNAAAITLLGQTRSGRVLASTEGDQHGHARFAGRVRAQCT